MDVLQWSRHYRCFPGQGALDVAALVERVLAAGYAGPAVARGLQRRLPPGRPGAHRDRRDALAARARGPAAAPPAPLDGFAFVEIGVDAGSAPDTEALLRAMGFAPRRPAPQQAGAAVGARRHPRRAQPRRRRRRPGGRGDRRLAAATRDASAARARGAARAGAGAPPRRRRGRPDGGRGARRHRRCSSAARTGSATSWPPARPAATACRSSASTTSRSRSRSRPSTRPGCSTAPCSTCSRARARSWRRPTGSCAAARSPPATAACASCSTCPRWPARAPGRAAARGVRVRATRSPPRARCASAACRCCDVPGNYYDDLAARLELEPALLDELRELDVLYDRDAPTASSCTSTRPASAGACSSRCSSGAAATAATAPPIHPSGWQRASPSAEERDADSWQSLRPPAAALRSRTGARSANCPRPPPLRRLIGPSVILVGVGVASGEYILFPYIASQAGLVFLWAAVVGVAVQFFINMEIERYTLATGETAIGSFQRLWRPWGAILAVGAVLATMWPGWATSAATVDDVRDRRRRPERDRDRHPARDRRDPDRLAGRLPDRREARVHQGRRGPGVHRDRAASPRSR